jgi:hypothetical protein
MSSSTKRQARTMSKAARNSEFAARKGIDQDVAAGKAIADTRAKAKGKGPKR